MIVIVAGGNHRHGPIGKNDRHHDLWKSSARADRKK